MTIGPAEFSIHPSSGVPIYRQLIDQVQSLVAGGRLKPGDTLPSVRELAGRLEVNPMTVSKAYSRLEADGVLGRLRGRGMVVAAASDADTADGLSLAARQGDVRLLVEQAVVRARQLNLTDRQFQAVVNALLKENPRG